jgi:4-hydroxy-tetrahydrodipicolinate reductase
MPHWQRQSITYGSEAGRRKGSAGNVTPAPMQRSIRVFQVATGNVGSEMIRRMTLRRDLELVGLHCYSPDKIGRDAGEIVGMAPVGVIATGAVDDIIAAHPDVVTFPRGVPRLRSV